MTRLGKNQRAVLEALARHNYWSYGCGWTYGSRLETGRYCRRLHQLGLVDVGEVEGMFGRMVERFTINDAGRAALEE